MTGGSTSGAGSMHRTTAKASWLLFLVALLVNFVGRKAGILVVAEIVGLLLFVAGIACGAFALTGIGRHGRKGILVPALIGLVLNALMVSVWIANFTNARNRARAPSASSHADQDLPHSSRATRG